MLHRLIRRFPLWIALTIVVAVVAACGAGGGTDGGSNATTTTPAAPDAVVTFNPGNGADAVNPLAPVTVDVAQGTLDTVTMTNDDGAPIEGIMTPDKIGWKPSVPLGYGRTYSIAVSATNADGKSVQQTSTFTTVTPGNQTLPTFVSSGGNLLTDGGTFGVGIVAVVHFDEPISDRAAAQKTLSVQTTPAVQGSWYWADDQNVHWRPQNYYAPGTKVTIRADVYGKEVSPGLFGQEDASTSFTIGDSHVSIADDNTKEVEVYENGNLIRTMPTSMGMGGSEQVGNQTITFWTQPGVYTVLDKANPVVMDSSTFGLPVNSRLGYKETINYATRISNDGIYLHQLDSTVWAQGNTNTSHGCLNLNSSNAQWFYNFAVPGDVVEVRNTGGAPLQQWQNGDWSVPWSEWVAGSAI
ncbi:L,D-transpeptidase [Actinomycetes bacterium M1A6_2h]